jgi:hypothetical protein
MKSPFVRSCVLCACLLAPAASAWAQPTAPTPPRDPAAPTGGSAEPAPAPPAPPAPAPAPAGAPTPAAPVPAPAAPAPAPAAPVPEPTAEKLFDTRVYGYLSSFLDQIAPFTLERPLAYDRASNKLVKELEPMGFNVDAFLMIQGTIGNRYRFFMNIATIGAGDPIEARELELRNGWVEASLYGQALAVRAGRMYRRFGLYNEILDATPTFIGIKEPEILDDDHLMITRTTNLMLHGAYVADSHKLEYALATGADEREKNQVPLGADLSYSYEHRLKLGVSYYDTMGKAKPGVAVGAGSPKGGVADWMAEDRYRAIDVYAQVVHGPWIAQLEYCAARHHGRRDPAAVLSLADPAADLSPAQYRRFFTDPYDDTPPTEADVIRGATYTAQTAYLRVGYELRDGMFTPYLQGDYYRNPETVPLEAFGGDNEAGFDDRGRFFKGALGFMFRPLPQIALKLEYGSHLFMKWGGTSYVDPELRASFSYFWEI